MWNIKATHTWELILHWAEWCDAIQLHSDLYDELVAALVEFFEVIYMWTFKSFSDLVRLFHFKEHIDEFVDEWSRVMGGGKERNYYHWLAVEAFIQLIESGSIWKYASDVTESLVHVIKETFLKYTTRGGANKCWTEQVLSRSLMKSFMKSLAAKEGVDMLSKFEQRKFFASLVGSKKYR